MRMNRVVFNTEFDSGFPASWITTATLPDGTNIRSGSDDPVESMQDCRVRVSQWISAHPDA